MHRTKTKCNQSQVETSKDDLVLRNITNNEVNQMLTRSKSSKILQSNITMIKKEQQNKRPAKRRKIQENPPQQETTKEQEETSSNQTEQKRKNRMRNVAVAATSEQNDSGSCGSSSVQQNQQNTANTLVEQFRKLEEVLGAKCANVVDRLKLEYTPYCVQNMEFCSNKHSKRCPRPKTVDRFESKTAKHLVDEGRAFHFLKFVEDMCMRAEFPGEYIISRIWELILTINPPDYEKYTSNDVIKECILVFENILYVFPPCWIPNSYYNVLTKPIDLKSILPTSNASQQTILQFVITMLNKIMCEEDNTRMEISTQSGEGNDSFFNFQEWEAKNSSKHNFEVLSRTEKLDRLFVILYLITKILELDLSIWMLRHFSTSSTHIYEENKMPLVSAVFNFSFVRKITDMVKNTLKVFICCTCFSYPQDQINFISRLVSVLSVAINLCEQMTTKNIKYPNVGSITESFAQEIFKSVDSFVGRNIPHYLSVIEHIKIPFVKYLVINKILHMMNPDPGKMCAKKIVENFRKERWLQCSEEDKDSSTNIEKCQKYAVVPSKLPKPKETEIYREQYLNILLEALKAYCDIFVIREIALLFNPKKRPPSSPESDKQHRRKSGKLEIMDAVKLSLMERDINKLVSKLNMKQNRYAAVSEPEKVEGIHVDDHVMLQYRDELKNLSFLSKIISGHHSKYGTMFDKWYSYIHNELFQVK